MIACMKVFSLSVIFLIMLQPSSGLRFNTPTTPDNNHEAWKEMIRLHEHFRTENGKSSVVCADILFTPSMASQWALTFKRYSGRSILVAGDSLTTSYGASVECAFLKLYNNTDKMLIKHKFFYDRDTDIVQQDPNDGKSFPQGEKR